MGAAAQEGNSLNLSFIDRAAIWKIINTVYIRSLLRPCDPGWKAMQVREGRKRVLDQGSPFSVQSFNGERETCECHARHVLRGPVVTGLAEAACS